MGSVSQEIKSIRLLIRSREHIVFMVLAFPVGCKYTCLGCADRAKSYFNDLRFFSNRS
jgi:hypothetical protein